MSWADFAILLICLASTLFGLWRGFAREALSLVTWLAAIWLAWRFSWVVEPWLGEWNAVPELKVWTARAIVFVLVLIAGGIVVWLTSALIRHTGLTGTDRTLGGLFGFARGALIVGLCVIVLELFGMDENRWWQDAAFREYGNQVAAGIRYYAEIGARYVEQYDLVLRAPVDAPAPVHAP